MTLEFQAKLVLWNEITRNGRVMAYREPILIQAEATDTKECSRLVVLHKEIECKNAEAAFLGTLRVRVDGEPSAVRRLLAATLSLHVDGENVFMCELRKLAYSPEFTPILPQLPEVSCLFKAKGFHGEDASHLETPTVGLFLPNGSLMTVLVDDLRSRIDLDASISVDLELGLYEMLVK